jgi:hypothetical protein
LACFEEAEAHVPADLPLVDQATLLRYRGHCLRHLGRLDEALSCFDSALAIKRGEGRPDLSAFESLAALDEAATPYGPSLDNHNVAIGRAMVLAEQGKAPEAIDGLERALMEVAASGHEHGVADLHAHLSLAHLVTGDLSASVRELGVAEHGAPRVLEPSLLALRSVIEHRRGRVEHAGTARAALRSWVKRTGGRGYEALVAMWDEKPSPHAVNQTLRVMLVEAAKSADNDSTPLGMMLGPDGRWFELDGGPRVDLSRRSAPRKFLLALVADSIGPSAGLSLDDLIEAGWPGESLVRSAASARVYVAISTLRKLGLESVLTRVEGRYQLDCPIRQ